ncbi:Thiosulfate sulfurtransferase TUM1 [Beauveria bassiana]|nr:Thiosulfate sulfurtransferase TUM1 [Beauveria bassiana]
MAVVSLLDAVESTLITPAELHYILKTLSERRNRVVCIAAGKDDAAASFERSHLPNSVYPVMLPTSQVFAAAMKRLDIRADDTLIVYDTADAGIYCAPRVAFTLTHFGFPHVYILNSFRQYVADGYPHSSAPFPPPAKPDDDDATTTTLFPFYYRVADDSTSIIDFQELRDLITSSGSSSIGHRSYQILDSRAPDCFFFSGSGAAGVGEGHMPGALNVSVTRLLDANKNLLPGPELRDVLTAAGVVEGKLTILTCNTGVTASILWLALRVSGYAVVKTRLYDGSWSEWKDRAAHQGLIVSDENAN